MSHEGGDIMKLEIAKGPSKEKLFDAFAHNHSHSAKNYSVFFSDRDGKRLDWCTIDSIGYENGGNDSFLVNGDGQVTWGKNNGSRLKFKGYYNTKTRSGRITIETPTE